MCIDLTKAYDSVNRKFVSHILHEMGIFDKWCKIIAEMKNSTTFSIADHGIPIGYFNSSFGL